eukprot:g15797.t1
MVKLSGMFVSCLKALKSIQLQLIDDELLNFDNLDLRASVWEGYRFGFRDPIFNFRLDSEQFNRLTFYIVLIVIAILSILCLLWYRSSRKRIFRWRLGIESTVCVGILLPEENIVARVGSGCLVRDANGEIGVLTNWHLFRGFVTAKNLQEIELCQQKWGKFDLKRHRRSFSNGTRLSYSILNPQTKIVIGTARDNLNGRPRWQFIAEFDEERSSPSADYTANGDGLDLVYLNLSNFVLFHGMKEKDRTRMLYRDLTVQNSEKTKELQRLSFKKKIHRWKLKTFVFGNTENLQKGYHKLRLLGYPGIGGHGLSVITDYFTGHRQDKTGAWLLTAQPMPNGCSGGAVVNPEGELVGVATQTQGDLSHIRSIVDASSILGFGGGEPVSQLLPWVEVTKSFSEELYRDVSRNDLKPTRLKRQITPRNLDRKESLPKYAKKAADGAQNSILVFFRRFFENYKLVDKSSSGNKDEQNSFDELSSNKASMTFRIYGL